MASNQARNGDMYQGVGSHSGTSCPHRIIGQFIGGSNDTYVNRRRAIHRGSQGISLTCPHHSGGDIAMGGSSTVYINNRSAHRRGDLVQLVCGVATTIEGSPNVFTGG